MPPRQFDTTWEADPHTIAKIAILEAYLSVWFRIMGQSMPGQDIVYIDGFAGPGEYIKNQKGSPVAALFAAKNALAYAGQNWKAGDIHYLVFAGQHPLGLEKMKEAMKKVDQNGSYRFSDAHVGQKTIFRFDTPANYSPKLYEQFKGQTVPYDDLRDYALNETPFINPKSMLKVLEDKNLIVVSSRDPKRRKGTFNPDKISSVAFKGGEEIGD